MYKQILSLLLCIVMILSFSVVSFAEEDRIPEAGDHVFFGHYEQDNDLNNGQEPIEWRVLEVNSQKMFLVSEYILDAMPFDTNRKSNKWETCTLRTWLNSEFLESAFSAKEAEALCLTEVKCGSVSNPSITEDYIYLLGFKECSEYLALSEQHHQDWTDYFSDKAYATSATEYAKSKLSLDGDNPSYVGQAKPDFMQEPYSPWWTRSYANSWHCAMIAPFCKFGGNGYWGHMNYIDVVSPLGVRPAVWVDINRYLDLLPADETESEANPIALTILTCDESITADTVLGDTAWKMWLPEGFVADELTEADMADNYIGYYLRDDDIIAVQYSDNSSTLAEWQKELADRGFTMEGLYNLNGSEAVLYRDEDADTITASVLDGKGKLLEVTFYPYSTMSEETDTVISSIQQEASKKRLSGAAGNSKTASDSEATNDAVPTAVSQEEAYQEMVAAYKAGKYKDSYIYYEQAKGYQDAYKYGNLLKARLCYDLKLKDSEVEALEKAIVNHIDFADSKDVLVCNSAIAHYYLLGTWYSTNGTYIYEVKSNGGVTTTVPVVPRTGNYYDIVNGTYWRYFEGKWDERTAVFDFNPISKNKMELYSYEVQQSYTFNKTK